MTSAVEHLLRPFLAIHISCDGSVQTLCPFLNWVICLQKIVLKNPGVSEFPWMPSYVEEVTNPVDKQRRIHFRKEQSWELMSLFSQAGCSVRGTVCPAHQWWTDTHGGVWMQDPVMKMAASRDRYGLHFYLFIFATGSRHGLLLS